MPCFLSTLATLDTHRTFSPKPGVLPCQLLPTPKHRILLPGLVLPENKGKHCVGGGPTKNLFPVSDQHMGKIENHHINTTI